MIRSPARGERARIDRVLALAGGANPDRRSRRSTRSAIGCSAIARFVDYRLTPKRLTPGYEHRLSRGALALGYVAFAAGAQAVQSRRGR